MRRILRCIAKTYDEVQAGIDADALFVAKLQQKEKEGDFIHLKREKLSKNMGGYEHSQLKAKHLQKIQVKDSIEATGVIAKGFLKNITVLREEVSTPIEPLLRDCYSLKIERSGEGVSKNEGCTLLFILELNLEAKVAAALVPKEGDVADFRTKQGSKELVILVGVVVALV
ncbi:hypothetical protein Tco_1244456 [Tanacetum coccineum]